MGLTKRKRSDSDLYHVMQRGNSRQLLFEDDADRLKYVELANSAIAKTGVGVVAWCLMDNHTHLLMRGRLEDLSKCMERLGGCYSRYFGKRHDRVGYLYQGRFKSKPVLSEAQLLTLIRYIHRNPVEEGLSDTCAYPWSSYVDLAGMRKEPLVSIVGDALALFESKQSFQLFNEAPEGRRETPRHRKELLSSFAAKPPRSTEPDVRQSLSEILARRGYEALPHSDRFARNDILRELKNLGYTVRQIERACGIGRNIIQRA